MSEPQLDPQPVEEGIGFDAVDFADPSILTRFGISDARWERARTAVDVRDLMRDFFGLSGNPISCPFHGRDSKPSFNFFPENNDCTCYGCGEGETYWDALRIVARTQGFMRGEKDDRAAALIWLEKNYPMPELVGDDTLRKPDIIIVDDEADATEEPQDPYAKLTVEALREPYVLEAARQVRLLKGTPDALPTAIDYLERLFSSLLIRNPLPLARVVDPQVVRALLKGTR